MKVLDPQSAVLTTSEVQHFLSTNPARAPDPRVGGYSSVNLVGYRTIRKDFDHYIRRTTPHILTYPPPEKWMRPVLSRLKAMGLTKTESLVLINLGLGLSRPSQKANTNHVATIDDEVGVPMEANGVVENGGHDDDMDERLDAEVEVERDDSLALSAVIEEIDSRFSEEQQYEILRILHECVVDGGASHEESPTAAIPKDSTF